MALVDELAHTNVPGSGRNEKRWQDVIEILDAGIDVITTVNIQHLESIADAVERITGVQIRERVPDWVLRKADQIELVDSSPEQLRRRMLHGNIYPPDKVPQALTHFFRTDNLIALRELALRFLADETEEQLLEHLRLQQRRICGRPESASWWRSPRLPVPRRSVAGRRGWRPGSRPIYTSSTSPMSDGVGHSVNDQLVVLRQLADDVGADWNEVQADDPAQAFIDFARARQITQIVVGSSSRSRRQELMGGGSIVRKISRLAGQAAIDVHIISRRDAEAEPHETTPEVDEP